MIFFCTAYIFVLPFWFFFFFGHYSQNAFCEKMLSKSGRKRDRKMYVKSWNSGARKQDSAMVGERDTERCMWKAETAVQENRTLQWWEKQRQKENRTLPPIGSRNRDIEDVCEKPKQQCKKEVVIPWLPRNWLVLSFTHQRKKEPTSFLVIKGTNQYAALAQHFCGEALFFPFQIKQTIFNNIFAILFSHAIN